MLQYLRTLLRDEGSEITSVVYQNKTCATRITNIACNEQLDVAFINILVSTPIPPPA